MTQTTSTGTRLPNVFLDGEPPPRFDDRDRLHTVTDDQATFKLLRGNRYEHFEPTGTTVVVEDRVLHVLAWTRSTFVAE